ncbi:hypothetical protein [Paeniglutamicibacter cryotolerans]|uniref:hypothetical protein n=1 Tax=Paeniglutamicibacter cryotolerans TaxID=670079 RepID=UPI00161E0A47|nr:hypothetical protein [Paeniglutamicibacter cryotolerans]
MSNDVAPRQYEVSGHEEKSASLTHVSDPETAAAQLWTWTAPFSRMTFSEDNVLEVGFSPGTTLTVATFMHMQEQYFSRTSELDAHLIIDISGLDGVAVGVAEYFSKVVSKNRVAILGSGPADRVLARFFIRKLLRDHSCAYFERFSAAREHVLTHA